MLTRRFDFRRSVGSVACGYSRLSSGGRNRNRPTRGGCIRRLLGPLWPFVPFLPNRRCAGSLFRVSGWEPSPAKSLNCFYDAVRNQLIFAPFVCKCRKAPGGSDADPADDGKVGATWRAARMEPRLFVLISGPASFMNSTQNEPGTSTSPVMALRLCSWTERLNFGLLSESLYVLRCRFPGSIRSIHLSTSVVVNIARKGSRIFRRLC